MSDEIYVDEDEEAGDPATGKFLDILSREEYDAISEFLSTEITFAEQERSGEEEEWKTIRRQRWARPAFARKNTPWPDASNVCPPGMMIATNTVFGMTKNAFGAKEPFWSISAMRRGDHDDIEIAAALERYLDLLAKSEFDLNKREKDREIQEETDSLGTSFVKCIWSTKKNRVTLADGTQVDAVFHDGPEWITIPREDIYYRLRTRDVQSARWIAHRIELEEHEVEERFASGKWTEFENWRDHVRTDSLEHQNDADELVGGASLQVRKWDFYEVFLRWDLAPKDGFWEDLIVVFHRETGSIVLAQVNPLGIRPIQPFNFIKRAFRLDGSGVGHGGIHMQAELEALHNNRINAVHLTTLKMFVARKNSGVKARETLSPGKIFLVDNVADFKTLETGEVYPSSLQAESNAWNYLQRATLMTETMAGFSDSTLKSRDSIGLQTSRIRASSGIVGAILEGMEDAYSSLGMMTVFQLVWNRDAVLENERKISRLTEDELVLLEKALSIRVEEIPIRLRFSVRTTDAETSYETERQNALTLWSIYVNYPKIVIPMLQQIYGGIPVAPGMPPQQLPQPVRETMLRIVTGTSTLLAKIFKFFGEDETGKYVPPQKLEELAFRMMDIAQEQALRRVTNGREEEPATGGAPGGPGGLAGNAPFPGMEGGGMGRAAGPGAGNLRAEEGEGAAGTFPGAGPFGSF